MGPPTKPDTSDGFDPPTSYGLDVLSPARDALRLDGVLESSLLSPQIQRFLVGWSSLNNAFGSAVLEGNPVEFRKAERVLREGKADDRPEEELLRLSRAYHEVHEADSLDPLDIDGMLELHEQLFDGIFSADKHPGELKDNPNGIRAEDTGKLVFECTPPDRTEAELEALLEWYYGPGQRMTPVAAAGLFFVEFQSIHPFQDGNGRVGRLLNLRLLKEAGLENVALTPLDKVIQARDDQYYDSLRATNQGSHYQVWLRYYSDVIRRAYLRAIAMTDLTPLLEDLSHGCEREVMEWALRNGLEWFQRGDFPNENGYAPQTVTEALSSLRATDLLDRKGQKRGTKYRVSEELLDRLRAAEDG
jgi:Fic family protein